MNLLRQLKGYSDNKDSNTKISFLDLWSLVYKDYKNRYNSKYPVMKSLDFYTDGRNTYSGQKYITVYYTIDGYPSKLPITFKDVIRSLAKTRGGTRVSFIEKYDSTSINWNSTKMKNKMRVWRDVSEDQTDVDSYNLSENVGKLNKLNWREESLEYLTLAQLDRGRQLFRFRTLVVISGERGEQFDNAIRDIEDYCAGKEILLTRVSEDLEDYLSYFCPYAQDNVDLVERSVGNSILTDEILSRFTTYSQGKIGDEGDYWGTDIYSGFMVTKVTKREVTSAENILITAETGGGKSYMVKVLLLQYLNKNNMTGTIIDYEGGEYDPIGSLVAINEEVVLLNMGIGRGAYYDPVEVQTTGDLVLDEDMYELSISFTKAILLTLVGKELQDDPWVSTIISMGISKAYKQNGVTSDRRTWIYSKGMSLHDVFRCILSIYEDCNNYSTGLLNIQEEHRSYYGDVTEEDMMKRYLKDASFQSTLNVVVSKLQQYLAPEDQGGIYSRQFSKRVSLSSIYSAKLVICSFNMKGKSVSVLDEVQVSLAQLSASIIMYMRSIFSQAQGKYNFKVWEEFQRWGDFEGAEKIIKTALTGGRKLGDINIIITNVVKELLDSDKFKIFGNITSFAIGAIDDKDVRHRLCERLSVPLLERDLDEIVRQKDINREKSLDGTDGPFDKAFLIRLDRTYSTIVKMKIPDYLRKSSIFETGVRKKGE